MKGLLTSVFISTLLSSISAKKCYTATTTVSANPSCLASLSCGPVPLCLRFETTTLTLPPPTPSCSTTRTRTRTAPCTCQTGCAVTTTTITAFASTTADRCTDDDATQTIGPVGPVIITDPTLDTIFAPPTAPTAPPVITPTLSSATDEPSATSSSEPLFSTFSLDTPIPATDPTTLQTNVLPSTCYTVTTTVSDPACPPFDTEAAGGCFRPLCVFETTATVPAFRPNCFVTPTVTALSTCQTVCPSGCQTFTLTATATDF